MKKKPARLMIISMTLVLLGVFLFGFDLIGRSISMALILFALSLFTTALAQNAVYMQKHVYAKWFLFLTMILIIGALIVFIFA